MTSPIEMASVSATRSSFIRFHTERATYAREAAEHFWPWNSNAPRISAVRSDVGVGGGVGDDEVLAAGLADDAGVGAVAGDVLADGAPQVLERRGGPGEVDARRGRGCWSATAETSRPSPGSMLITPGGMPASSSSSIVRCAATCWVGDGFQTTVLPMSAGAVGRLPAIAVKLNGVIA